MKFFAKKPDSSVLTGGVKYRENAAANNQRLKEMLITEQKGFCAYTEKYLAPLEAVEVEHFNAALKYADDYYNYYAVIRTANLYKQDEKYKGASFFQSLFFHSLEEFNRRIGFDSNLYYELDENDEEARDLLISSILIIPSFPKKGETISAN